MVNDNKDRRNRPRRRYFIDPSFQTRFIFRFSLIVLASSLLITALVLLLTWNSTTVTIEKTRVLVKPTTAFFLPVVLTTVVAVTIFSSLAVMALSLFQSHKIAGPLFRLKKEIDLLKEGAMDRNFTLRDKDQLQALALSLEEMSETLQDKHIELNSKYFRLRNFLLDKDYSIPPQDREKLCQLLDDVSSTLNYFKV